VKLKTVSVRAIFRPVQERLSACSHMISRIA
jgi:hypothetical protein